MLSQMLRGEYTGKPSSGVTFMSNLLGNAISWIYQNFSIEVSIYGLMLLISNLIILLAIIKIINVKRNNIAKWVGLIAIVLIFPVLILSPTFTITAMLLIGLGILGITLFMLEDNKSNISFTFFLVMILLGILIRIEALYGIIIFIIPTCLLYIVLNFSNKLQSRIIIFSIVTTFSILIVLFFQHTALNDLIKEDYEFSNYVKFQDVHHLLTYTPSYLKLHQEIIAGNAMRGIWSNVDFIVLRNWAYADFTIFGFENMRLGSEYVSGFTGLKGLLAVDLVETLKLITYLLKDQLIVILTLLVVSALILVNGINRIRTFFLITSLSLSYLSGFYFLAAVLRIPNRTSFPLLFVFLIFLVIISDKNARIFQRFLSRVIPIVLLSVLTISFHLNSDFGLSKLISSNENKLNFSVQRNSELERFSKSATYVGPTTYFPTVNQGVLSKNLYWSSGERILPLSWSTYSPNWYDMVRKLSLDDSNIYLSLAKKENVYWVSNSYLAEILDMYMNDRQIYRGKLCSVAKLSGPDQAEIFTYQAKEDDC